MDVQANPAKQKRMEENFGLQPIPVKKDNFSYDKAKTGFKMQMRVPLVSECKLLEILKSEIQV